MKRALGIAVWLAGTAVVTTLVLVLVRRIGPLQRAAGIAPAGLDIKAGIAEVRGARAA